MRIRTRDNLKKKNIAITCLFLLPIIGFGSYAGMVLTIVTDISSYSRDDMKEPDTDFFFEKDVIDEDILEDLVHHYDWQLEKYHMPANISVNAHFESQAYKNVTNYEGTDNGQLHIAYSIAANCLRFKWAMENNRNDLIENATRVLTKLVTALKNTLAAPNGGFGKKPGTDEYYPGTLARFVVPPGYQDIHPFMYTDHVRHFNGTGEYKNWRVRLKTSRDELGGFYLSTASVLNFIMPYSDYNDECEWIVETVKTAVAQLIEGFRDTNWLLLGGHGEPVGSDINPVLEGSTWQLALLRIGATAYPERYESLYNYVAAKILSMGGANMGSVHNTVEGYYAFSFGLDVMLSLIWLEDDARLRYHYISNYENNFYPIVRYHRNNFFNIAHLIFMKMLDEDRAAEFQNPDYEDETILWDFKDQLWRFYSSGWADGIRNYNLTQRPHSTRATSTHPKLREKVRDPAKKKWREFFETSTFGELFSWIEVEFDFDQESENYILPLRVSEYGVHHWLWEHNKLDDEGGTPNGDGLTQAAPNTYICTYWMAKAYGLL
ncbi:MAG: hypothetical protein R6U96_06745 [Promethearchaeia archaeon]